MKISLNWLGELIDLKNIQASEIKYILTSIGLEVASTEKFHPIKGGLEGLKIGKVLEFKKIEGTNNLSATKVDIGGKVLDIVCGAPNVAENQKVVVATVGTTLYYKNEVLKIKKVKLRGHVSEGMICAEDEIGLGDSHDGILVLDENAPVGKDFKNYVNIPEDTVIEVELTPNRIDAASHYGVARDIFAYYNANEKYLKLKKRDAEIKIDNNSLPIDIIIEDNEGCKRYTGISIKGVTVKESPDWLKYKLMTIGLTPINNIVDITNFVLHETGQPLHAFDADKIKGNTIKVKTLPEGTPFTTLDDVGRKLSAEDLMICDAENTPLCMAGVFGGKYSGITEETKNIFLESAWFNPVFIRKSAKRHNLHTDASFRFERGTDINNTVYPLKLAAKLIKELAGGEIAMEINDVYPEPVEEKVVELDFDYVTTMIGKELDRYQIKNILEGLEIKIIAEKEKSILVSVPTYRVDVTRPADVVEEILRIYGYNNIEIPSQVKSVLTYRPKPDKEVITNSIANFLTSKGYREIMNNSLTASEYYNSLTTYRAQNLVMIKNPLSSELNAMRQTLLFGMLESIVHNINRQKKDIRFYELGNVVRLTKPEDKSNLDNYSENYSFAIAVTGTRNENMWNEKPVQNEFFELKSQVESILNKLGIAIHEKIAISDDIFDFGLEYKNNSTTLFRLGKVNSKITKKFEIETPVFYAETNFENLINRYSDHQIKFEDLPKFPEVQRDIAVLIDKQITFNDIEKLIASVKSKLIKEVFLFDVYENEEKLGKGKKSYAVRLILQDKNKTLKDEEANKVMFKIINKLEKELNASVRS